MPREPETCSTCRAWQPLTLGLPGFVEGELRGECHHNAPFPLTNGEVLIIIRWPLLLLPAGDGAAGQPRPQEAVGLPANHDRKRRSGWWARGPA